MIRSGIAAILLAACAGPAFAQSSRAPSPAGRYALDAAACEAGDIFATMTAERIDFPVFSCIAVEYDQIQDSGGVEMYEVYGRCVTEGESREFPHRFHVVKSGDALQVRWSDGTESAILVACAAQPAP